MKSSDAFNARNFVCCEPGRRAVLLRELPSPLVASLFVHFHAEDSLRQPHDVLGKRLRVAKGQHPRADIEAHRLLLAEVPAHTTAHVAVLGHVRDPVGVACPGGRRHRVARRVHRMSAHQQVAQTPIGATDSSCRVADAPWVAGGGRWLDRVRDLSHEAVVAIVVLEVALAVFALPICHERRSRQSDYMTCQCIRRFERRIGLLTKHVEGVCVALRVATRRECAVLRVAVEVDI